MPPDDPYAPLAPIFDAWAGWFAGAAIERIEPLLAAHGSAPAPGSSSFVDIACGTGSLLMELRRLHPGWRLCGTDISDAMLAEARRKPDAGGIVWAATPMTEPPPGGPFDAAGCFFDALNHLSDADELGRAFAAAAAALRPGGLYLFDVNNLEGFRNWWGGERAFSGAGWRLTTHTSFDGVDRARGRSVVVRGGRRDESVVVERWFPPDEIRGRLAAAGLEFLAEEPWSPLGGGDPGKTLYACRRV